MVPWVIPGEKVRARVFRNHKNYSEADLVEVLAPSPPRAERTCPLFGVCGGCQYEHIEYADQLEWKRRRVEGRRGGEIGAIGFLRAGERNRITDVPRCPIATDGINEVLPEIRATVRKNAATYRRGATILVREAEEGVVTDPATIITEKVGEMRF